MDNLLKFCRVGRMQSQDVHLIVVMEPDYEEILGSSFEKLGFINKTY